MLIISKESLKIIEGKATYRLLRKTPHELTETQVARGGVTSF